MTAALIVIAATISSPGPWFAVDHDSGWLPDRVASADTPGSDDAAGGSVSRITPTAHAMVYSICDGWEERTCYPAMKDPSPIEVSSRRVLGYIPLKRSADGIIALARRGFVDELPGYKVYWGTTAPFLPPDVEYPIPVHGWQKVESLSEWVNVGLIFEGVQTDGVYRIDRPQGTYGYGCRYMFPLSHLEDTGHWDMSDSWHYYFDRELEHSFVDNVNSNYELGVATAITNLTRRIVEKPLAALNQAESILDRTYAVGEVVATNKEYYSFSASATGTSRPHEVYVWCEIVDGEVVWYSEEVRGSEILWDSISSSRSTNVTKSAMSGYSDMVKKSDGSVSARLASYFYSGDDDDYYSVQYLFIWDLEEMVSDIAARAERYFQNENIMTVQNPGHSPFEMGRMIVDGRYSSTAGVFTTEHSFSGLDDFRGAFTAIGTVSASYGVERADIGSKKVPTLPPGSRAFNDDVVKSCWLYSTATMSGSEYWYGDGEIQQSIERERVYGTNEMRQFSERRAQEIRAKVDTDLMTTTGRAWNDPSILPGPSSFRPFMNDIVIGGTNSVSIAFHMPEIRVIFKDTCEITHVQKHVSNTWEDIDVGYDPIPISVSCKLSGEDKGDTLTIPFDAVVKETLTSQVDWQFNHVRRGQ